MRKPDQNTNICEAFGESNEGSLGKNIHKKLITNGKKI
jgi:hypothetical protein